MESIGLKAVKALTLISVAALCVVTVLMVMESSRPPPSPDEQRADFAKSLMEALEKYRSARHAYPIFGNNPVSDLKTALVDGGYLAAIPRDLPDAQPMRYISTEGTYYGILSTRNRQLCIIEVGVSNTGWWGPPPLPPCAYP